MTFKNYQLKAIRTCVDLGSLQLNLSHMVLGIISEMEEFMQAMVNNDMVNAREEQADIMWYIANYCNFRKFDLEEILGDPYTLEQELDDFESNVITFDLFTSRLSDYVKKFVAYGKPLDENLEKRALKAIVWSLTIEDTGFEFEKDLQKNINKLMERYPDKYSDERALNRNLDAERKILES